MANNKNNMSILADAGTDSRSDTDKIYQHLLANAAANNGTSNGNVVTTLYDTNTGTFAPNTVVDDNGISTTLANGQTVSFAKNIDVPTETPTVPETPDNPGTTGNEDAYQKALQSVYASYQAAEDARARALQENYNNAVRQAQNSFNAGKDSLRQNTDDALRQAYISYMLGQRGLNQQLANGGINGGATESVLANLYNNYGNNRASIENAYNNSLADLVANYNNNVANLGANYNTNYANALADYNNQVANTQSNYASTLANLLSKQSAATDNSANASYDKSVSTMSKYINNPSGALAYANMLLSSGKYTADEIDEIMFDSGLNPAEVWGYFDNDSKSGNVHTGSSGSF